MIRDNFTIGSNCDFGFYNNKLFDLFSSYAGMADNLNNTGINLKAYSDDLKYIVSDNKIMKFNTVLRKYEIL
jgi:hypothetical protein